MSYFRVFKNKYLKLFVVVVLFFCTMQLDAEHSVQQPDTLRITPQNSLDPDSLLEHIVVDTIPLPKKQIVKPKSRSGLAKSRIKNRQLNLVFENQAFDSLMLVKEMAVKDSLKQPTLPLATVPIYIDSLLLQGNPLFIDLVYLGYPLNFDWNLPSDFNTLYYRQKPSSLTDIYLEPIKRTTPDQFIANLRTEARKEITRKSLELYVFSFDKLPDPNGNKSYKITGKELDRVQFVDDEHAFNRNQRKLVVKKAQIGPWQKKGALMVQFSQNYVSANWYQGGNSNVAVLGILSGQLNYDNKKDVQWENSAEWKMGFNSVSGDTLRMLRTNEDVFRFNSKLGLRAGGNWFYSGSLDFSTQLFNSYKGLNSIERKTAFLTPVRINIGIGLDYKYKKIFSIMVSPISYKHVYANLAKNVDLNSLGIKAGERSLSEIGSAFKAQLSYPLSHEIQLDSKLSFYTNYEKVEIDWEIVCNMTINRFMSTRISLNPRYDNTVIVKDGDHATIQFKQLLSVGFSHKL